MKKYSLSDINKYIDLLKKSDEYKGASDVLDIIDKIQSIYEKYNDIKDEFKKTKCLALTLDTEKITPSTIINFAIEKYVEEKQQEKLMYYIVVREKERRETQLNNSFIKTIEINPNTMGDTYKGKDRKPVPVNEQEDDLNNKKSFIEEIDTKPEIDEKKVKTVEELIKYLNSLESLNDSDLKDLKKCLQEKHDLTCFTNKKLKELNIQSLLGELDLDVLVINCKIGNLVLPENGSLDKKINLWLINSTVTHIDENTVIYEKLWNWARNNKKETEFIKFKKYEYLDRESYYEKYPVAVGSY